MTQTRHTQCDAFRDRLDAWLAAEYTGAEMQAHHDACAGCRAETELARAIGGITSALPLLRGPDIAPPAAASAARGSLIAQLLNAWRQPLVFVPALALLLALVLVPQFRGAGTALEPEFVIIDGRQYSREEIRKATADLELALRYIDRYRPARVISAELDTGNDAPVRRDERNTQDTAEPTI